MEIGIIGTGVCCGASARARRISGSDMPTPSAASESCLRDNKAVVRNLSLSGQSGPSGKVPCHTSAAARSIHVVAWVTVFPHEGVDLLLRVHFPYNLAEGWDLEQGDSAGRTAHLPVVKVLRRHPKNTRLATGLRAPKSPGTQ